MENFLINQEATDEVIAFPCSATQKQFWLINQLMPKNSAYNIPLGFVASSNLNVDAVEKAVQLLVERHEVLRMTYHWEGEELEQHLLEDYQFQLIKSELGDASFDECIVRLTRRHFDLGAQPPFFAECIALPDGKFLVYFGFHHVIVDHRAVLIFQEEFKTAYAAYSQNNEPEFEELEIQFGDYVLWREENFTDEDLKPVYEFWVDHLKGQTGKLNLPLDNERSQNIEGSGKELNFEFTSDVSRQIIEFAKASSLSPYIVGLGALKVLLHRYTSQNDIIVGSPFTERGLLDELQDVMGCFMNMLPLASIINGSDTYESILKQQSTDFLEVLDNLTVSMDEIVNRLNLSREPGMNPLFQVGYTFQEAPAAVTIPGLEIDSLQLHSGGAMYDLHIWLWDDGGTIKGSVWYADEYFEADTVNKFVADFEVMFAALVKAPKQPIAQLIPCVTFADADDIVEDQSSLSTTQQLYWFSEQFAHLGALQNIASVWHCDTVADVDWASRLKEAVSGNPYLKSTLALASDEQIPSLVVTDASEIAFSTTNVATAQEAKAFLMQQASEPFSLLEETLLRVAVVTTDSDGVFLGVIAHTLLLDGESLDRLARQLVTGEAVAAAERQPVLAAHPYHLKRFWKDYLNRDWGILELTVQLPRPDIFDHAGDYVSLTVEQDQASKIGQFASQHGIAIEAVWITLIQSLVYRHTQQEQLGFGLSIPAKNVQELGSHTDIIPYLADVSGLEAFTDACLRTQTELDKLNGFRGIGYQEILSYAIGEKDAARTPLTQCYISVNRAVQTAIVSDSVFNKCHIGTTGARTDIAFLVEADETKAHVGLEFASSIYSKASIENMLLRFESMLDFMLVNPNEKIDDVPILRNEEIDLLEANSKGPEAPLSRRDLVALFAESVKQNGDKTALNDQQTSLTYDELWALSGIVASGLVDRGLQGSIVALYMDRTVDMVVAILGVLRAGATYLPLDPDNPLDRIKIVLEDSKAKICISDSSQIAALADLDLGIERLPIEDLKASTTAASLDNIAIDPQQMAYVIFTSGSTGRPKGVMVQHEAVVNFLLSMAKEPGMSSSDTLLATTTISFDIAVLELMMPLAIGAQVVIASRKQAMDGAELQRLIDAHSINYLQATPTSWRILMATGWQGQPSMKALVGGEALTEDLRDQLTGKVSELWNMYGPTETTVWSTCKRVTQDSPFNCVGKPIDNTTVYVLNASLKQQPLNVPGELCIGGVGVTLGYFEREELTQDRFVTLASGERVYRTGDLVHLGEDGNVYYHRRLDDQVKIRGYRIELGEIESKIRDIDTVKNAAVIVAGANPSEHKLVAYIQYENDSVVTSETYRTKLADSLPGYMIPQHFIAIDDLPRTSSGKVDKKTLTALPIEVQEESNFTLDEAASALFKALPEIKDAYVVNDLRGGEKICHYQVVEDEYVTLGTLRKLARQELPEDTVLRQFIEVQEWPADEEGVVNWLALHDDDGASDQPQTEMEVAVYTIWSDIIGSKAIRRSDNFFDVGGHSLLAVQVLMRVKKELGVDITQDRLLLSTLEGFAAECDSIKSQSQPSSPSADSQAQAPAQEEAPAQGDIDASATETSDAPSADAEEQDEKSSKGIFSRIFRR